MELRAEVCDILQEADYLLFLPLLILNINIDEMDATELRAWLFETHMIYNDREAYEALNVRIKELNNYSQSVLQIKSLELRASIFRQREEWQSILRSF